MNANVYILYSEKMDKFYIGSTSDLQRRLLEHNRGKEKFTKNGMPWLLVYKEDFNDLKDARSREKFIKKQKSRKYIITLIKEAR
jgi:putative endonuclease